MTPDNLTSSWIYFEAGALSKVIDSSKVAPVLFRLKPSDMQGPLAQFQLTTSFERSEIKRLIESINFSLGDKALDPSRLDKAFDALWGKLSDSLNAIETQGDLPLPPVRDVEHLNSTLEEVLALTRKQAQLLSSPNMFNAWQDKLAGQIERVIEDKDTCVMGRRFGAS